MANPVGEDSWLAYVDEERRQAKDLDTRIKAIENLKKAVLAEPGSLKIWLTYCEYFWSLFNDCQSSEAGWSEEEQRLGRELFPFADALRLWGDGYDAVKYRLSDSHMFWDRWIEIEQDQLVRMRTSAGVRRISHLFRDRLQTPHATWDQTSQMFSTFLSTYNNSEYETEFKMVTASAQGAKDAYEQREPYELKLKRAVKEADVEAEKTVVREYLDWEMAQVLKNPKDAALTVALCFGLYSRALTGVFALDDEIWNNYAVYLSTLHREAKTLLPATPYRLPTMIGLLQRAVSHCPWSGMLWSRYILSAEEAGWPFADVESIKHAATNTKALDKNGMTGVLDMYAAWCGYLKRTAMDPNAHEDAVDIADVGLRAALEDVQLWGERLYKKKYLGDPKYRLQRIFIQLLTEKKGDINEARATWNGLASKPLHADSYEFWLNYHFWEMMVFASQTRQRSPTPANGAKAVAVPLTATTVLTRAMQRRTLDWPERVMEVYQQHCNDYEQPETLHQALDLIHKAKRSIAKRRAREQAEALAVYTAQARQAHDTAADQDVTMHDAGETTSSSNKRKRGDTGEGLADPTRSKRSKSTEAEAHQGPVGPATTASTAAQNAKQLKRDRENTSILVTQLPVAVTATAVKKYFKEYGVPVEHLAVRADADAKSASALIELRSPEDVQTALLKDNKYFGQAQIRVRPGTNLTVYVTNYPPAADESYIRALFKDCGDIFSVRWPSLKFNGHRRFCYLSFKDPVAAARATKLDGTVLENKYKLVSKYSEPHLKKKRDGAVVEGRELQIKNLPLHTTEADLRALTEKYGQVEAVKIVKNMAGTSVGTAYIVLATREQAEAALQLDKTNLKAHIIQVEISKPTNYKPFATIKDGSGSAVVSPANSVDVEMRDGSPAGKGHDKRWASKQEIRERSFALLDVPDTVNDARIKALAGQHGHLVQVVLRPDHQGAIVEFTDVAAVGRAMLALEGHEIETGRKLRTGTVDQLLNYKAEKREEGGVQKGARTATSKSVAAKSSPAFMPPAPSIRRAVPASAGRGARGGRRGGLGFVQAKTQATTDAGDANNDSGQAAGPTKPKSNAEFKEIFLASKASTGTDDRKKEPDAAT